MTTACSQGKLINLYHILLYGFWGKVPSKKNVRQTDNTTQFKFQPEGYRVQLIKILELTVSLYTINYPFSLTAMNRNYTHKIQLRISYLSTVPKDSRLLEYFVLYCLYFTLQFLFSMVKYNAIKVSVHLSLDPKASLVGLESRRFEQPSSISRFYVSFPDKGL